MALRQPDHNSRKIALCKGKPRTTFRIKPEQRAMTWNEECGGTLGQCDVTT